MAKWIIIRIALPIDISNIPQVESQHKDFYFFIQNTLVYGSNGSGDVVMCVY